MNKAKALFVAGIVVLVAGASAVGLYLNENDKLDFGENDTPAGDVADVQEYEDAQQDDEYIKEDVDENKADAEETSLNQQENEDAEEDVREDNEPVDVTEINRFLSMFSGLYFSEKSVYTKNNPDMYELLKFAYLYADVFENGEGLTTESFDDDIGFYNGIRASSAQRIADRYFGVDISEESVFTENSYQFFMYRDGFFYTPAADGLGYVNKVVADSVVKNGNSVSVIFTIYSDGVSYDMSSAQAKEQGTVYASGSAELQSDNGGYKLVRYSVDF